MDSGGSAYPAEQTVRQELEQGLLFRASDAPTIERTAFADYRPEDEKREEMRQALKAFKDIGEGGQH